NGQTLGRKQGLEKVSYLFNHLGSTADVVNLATNDITPYRYDAWGNFRELTPIVNNQNRLTFTNQYFDASTGLYCFGQGTRFLDADLGIFTQKDPVYGDLDEPRSQSPYAYAWGNPIWYKDPTGRSIWVTNSLQKFQDKIKEGKPNVQGNFTFRRSTSGSESPLSEDEMKDKDRRLRAAINAFTDSTGKPTKIGQQILDTPLHAGSVIITEGTDQVNNVINQMAGENATEAEREIIIAGALAKGLFRLNKDGVLQVVAGKVAALDSVKQVGAQSLDMLERINAVNYGLQGVQEVVLGAARVYGAVASIATAPVTTLVGASAGMVSRAFYEEQYNNRPATLGQLAQSAELGSAVANVGVAVVNLARVAARAVSIGDDIIQLGIAGGPKPNIPPVATGASAASTTNLIDDIAGGGSNSGSGGAGANTPVRGFISGDKGALRNTVKRARAGYTDAQGELEIMKTLRDEGFNVYQVDPAVRPGVTHDILFGGPPRVASGFKGEVKTLSGPEFVENTAVQHLFKARKQVGPGGTIFLNHSRTNATPERLDNFLQDVRSGVYLDQKGAPFPSDVNVRLWPLK
ncbi:RHS repeat-associated core domain-containing protein, partial [Candidatus Woesearchaeota archaeon]|nr:RHS repeat-associated core domain-containing protein [Candidatus Woesearchaeota archaeon]